MITSGYEMHLYCDNEKKEHPYDEFPHRFTGETFGECAKRARRMGWRVNRKKGTAVCPMCSGKRPNR